MIKTLLIIGSIILLIILLIWLYCAIVLGDDDK